MRNFSLLAWLALACSDAGGGSTIEVRWATMEHGACPQCVAVEYHDASGAPEVWWVDTESAMRWTPGEVREVKVLEFPPSDGNARFSVALIPSESGQNLLEQFTKGGRKSGPVAVFVGDEMVDLGALAPDSRMLLLDDFRDEQEVKTFLARSKLTDRVEGRQAD